MVDEVDLVDGLVGRLKEYELRPITLIPDFWNKYSNRQLDWSCVEFKKTSAPQIPQRSGLYTFVIEHDTAGHSGCRYLTYVGKAEDQSLRVRFQDYFAEAKRPAGRPKIRRMIRLWGNYLRFYYAVVPKSWNIPQLENDLMKAMQPPFNDQYTAEISRARKAAF